MNELNKRKLYIDGNGDVQAAETTIPSGGTGFMPQTNEDSVNVTFKGATTLKNALDMIDSSTQALQNLVGESFSPDIDYNVGDRVNYQGRFYKFTDNHPAGEWTGSDVEEYTLDIPIPVIPSSDGIYLLYGSNYQGKTTYNWKKELDIDKYSYGIGWYDLSSTCEPVGSTTMHNDLPVNNSLKACVTKFVEGETHVGNIVYGGRQEFQYWLNPTDWNFKLDGTPSVLTGADNTNIMIHNDVFYYKSFKGINRTTRQPLADDAPANTRWNEVRISPYPIDNTWTRMKAGYTSFGKTTHVDNKARCFGTITDIANDPSSKRMQYSELATWQSSINSYKPTVSVSRSTYHQYALNAGGHQMTFDEYKMLFYWLPAIEFCTFQIEDNSTIISQYGISSNERYQFRSSVINDVQAAKSGAKVGYPMTYLQSGRADRKFFYNLTAGSFNFNPNGYTNELASGTGWKRFWVPAWRNDTNNTSGSGDSTITQAPQTCDVNDDTLWFALPVCRYRGFELDRGIWTNLHGVWGIVSKTSDNSLTKIYATNNRELFTAYEHDINMPVDSFEDGNVKNSDIRLVGTQSSGWVREWHLNDKCDIIGSVYGDSNKMDYNWTRAYNSSLYTNPRSLDVEGNLEGRIYAGPGASSSSNSTHSMSSNIGARWRVNDDEYESIYN